jgi:hypothetical protein
MFSIINIYFSRVVFFLQNQECQAAAKRRARTYYFVSKYHSKCYCALELSVFIGFTLKSGATGRN